MNKTEILNTFKRLACSQGMYSRILRDITDEALDYLESQHFKSPVDLILFVEG